MTAAEWWARVHYHQARAAHRRRLQLAGLARRAEHHRQRILFDQQRARSAAVNYAVHATQAHGYSEADVHAGDAFIGAAKKLPVIGQLVGVAGGVLTSVGSALGAGVDSIFGNSIDPVAVDGSKLLSIADPSVVNPQAGLTGFDDSRVGGNSGRASRSHSRGDPSGDDGGL
jgi:hypothetical protein